MWLCIVVQKVLYTALNYDIELVPLFTLLADKLSFLHVFDLTVLKDFQLDLLRELRILFL